MKRKMNPKAEGRQISWLSKKGKESQQTTEHNQKQTKPNQNRYERLTSAPYLKVKVSKIKFRALLPMMAEKL